MTTLSSVTWVAPCNWVGINTNGLLEVFARGTDDSLQHNWQTSPGGSQWSGWRSLGGSLRGDPVVAPNFDGRLEVFARDSGNGISHIWQTAPHSAWSGWTPLGGGLPFGAQPAGSPVAAVNGDGRLEVFVRDTKNNISHIWQTAKGNGWSSGWEWLIGGALGDPVVVSDTDGRLEAFANGTPPPPPSASPQSGSWQPSILHAWQRHHIDGWASGSLGGYPNGNPTAVRNADGQLEVFAIGLYTAFEHIWQTSPGNGWSDWRPLGSGGTPAGTSAVAANPDGRLEVLVRDADNQVSHIWQTRPAPNGEWQPVWAPLSSGGPGLADDPAVAANADGRLEVFARFSDGTVQHNWQNTAGDDQDWSGWRSLGLPGGPPPATDGRPGR